VQNISNTPDLDDVSGQYFALDVNDSGHVVWAGDNGSDYEVLYFDGVSVENISNNPGIDDGTQYWGGVDLNNAGDVAWGDTSDSPGVSGDIWFYDGTLKRKLSDEYGMETPRINATGEVTWCGPENYWPDMYFWDGASVSEISDVAWSNWWQRINAEGDVVWHANNSGFAERGWAVSSSSHNPLWFAAKTLADVSRQNARIRRPLGDYRVSGLAAVRATYRPRRS
jgi:hypothetical protein